MYYLISEAAFLLGVHPTTIRRWDKGGKIKCMKTVGNHRRISKEEIERIIAGKKRRYAKRKRGVVSYARVSSKNFLPYVIRSYTEGWFLNSII